MGLAESFFQNLIFLLCLMLIGEPFRFAIAHFSRLFRNLNMLEAIVLDFYVGGLTLYVMATIPLRLFSPEILMGLLFVCLVLSLFLHRRDVLQLAHVSMKSTKLYFLTNASAISEGSIVLCLFLTTLWLESVPITGLVFGNVQDSSLYGLFVKLILQNRQVPVNLLPYSAESIIYPQAFFIIEAFGHFVIGLSPAEITLRVSPLFQALAVLGAYYLGRRLSPKKYIGLSFAFVFFAVSRWPRLLAWGSNPFVGGFALYFICIGLLSQLYRGEKTGKELIGISFTGILLGYLGAINLVFLQALLPAILIFAFLSSRRVKKGNTSTYIRTVVLCSLLLLGCSVAVISPYVYRFAVSVGYSGHNIGLPTDVLLPSTQGAVSQQIFELTQIYQGFFSSDWISPYRILKFETVLLISTAIAVISISLGMKKSKLKDQVATIAVSLISVVLLLAMRTVGALVSISVIEIVTNWAETAILIFVSFCFFVCILNVLLYDHIYGLFCRWRKHSFSAKKVYAAALTLVILSSIYAPYLYYLFLHDSTYLTGQYDIFCVTTQNDLELMQWMKQNTPKESVVLINPHDAGGFVPVVTDLKVIYPFIQSRSSLSYLFLTGSLDQGNLSSAVYDMLDQLNITHVFIGERAMSGYARFDPLLFLGNPNFRLERRDGDAYLLALAHANRSVVFSDDFERSSLEDKGWKTEFSSANSSGEATIVYDPQKAFDGSRCLRLSAGVAAGTNLSSTWVFRRVYMPSFETQPSVKLVFYLDYDGSAGNSEGFSVIFSDRSWTKQVFISTYERGGYTLPAAAGLFEVDLGRIWNETFHSKLPSTLFFQLENTAKDGFENAFYVDRIQLIVSDK